MVVFHTSLVILLVSNSVLSQEISVNRYTASVNSNTGDGYCAKMGSASQCGSSYLINSRSPVECSAQCDRLNYKTSDDKVCYGANYWTSEKKCEIFTTKPLYFLVLKSCKYVEAKVSCERGLF